MKQQTVGPTKFSRGAKTATTALTVTSVIGLWNLIGHMEAGAQVAVAAAPAEPPVVTLNLPVIQPLPTPAPIPTLRAHLTDFQLDPAALDATIDLVLPSMPALAPLPTLAPLPALPQMPAPPPPSNSGGGGGGGGGSSKSKKSGSS
jgi:hypothetical protein